jgi:hypothetical protein
MAVQVGVSTRIDIDPSLQNLADIAVRARFVRLVPEADVSIGHAKASNSTLT